MEERDGRGRQGSKSEEGGRGEKERERRGLGQKVVMTCIRSFTGSAPLSFPLLLSRPPHGLCRPIVCVSWRERAVQERVPAAGESEDIIVHNI